MPLILIRRSVLKEIIDPKFDWEDVGYDALGAATVPLLVISW